MYRIRLFFSQALLIEFSTHRTPPPVACSLHPVPLFPPSSVVPLVSHVLLSFGLGGRVAYFSLFPFVVVFPFPEALPLRAVVPFLTGGRCEVRGWDFSSCDFRQSLGRGDLWLRSLAQMIPASRTLRSFSVSMEDVESDFTFS